MKNQNITFQQFLEKIKTIDVGELLEKAKTIKVEDKRFFKFNDLKEISKSPYFFPTLGILFATLTSILFFIPSFESLKEKQSKSQKYKFESQELPFIDEELMKRSKSQQKFDVMYEDFIGLVANKSDLVLIPKILNDSSKRSGVEIIEFSPITSDDLNSCKSVSEEDLYNNFGDNFNSENFEDNFDMPMEDMNIDDFGMDINESELKVKEFFINGSEGISEW